MHVTVACDDAALAALWDDWQALWATDQAADPFLSVPWLRPWWSVFGTGRPVVAALWHNGVLIGLLPLYRLGEKLLPLGVGISDYFDMLLAPSAPADAGQQLLQAALGTAALGTASLGTVAPIRCDLPELPPGARLRTLGAPPGWTDQAWDGPPCPVLALQPEPAVPKNMRRDLRQARHRAERAGGWSVERADAATLPALFGELVRLHGSRWEARDTPGVLADPDVLAFHRAADPGLLAAGLLRLQVLRLRAQAAAAIYALAHRRRIHFYLTGFDPAFRFESPGSILLGQMIGEAARDCLEEAHFLRGGERYKYAWGAVDRFNAGRSFCPE